ncbi:MAG: ABC transporter permease [Thermincolia bacterium]
MDRLYAGVQNELHKLFARRGTIFFMFLLALFPLVAGPLLGQFQSRMGIAAVDASGFALIILDISTSLVLPLFIFMAAADSFTGEVGTKTLKLTLTRPISRLKIFISKTITLGLYISVMLAIIWITSLISGLFWVQGFSFQGLYKVVIAYIVSWLPLMVLGLMAVSFAQGFKSSSSALIVTLILYVVMKLLLFLFPSGAALFPPYYTDWYLQWIQGSSYDRLYQGLIYLLSGCTFFFTLGYYAFNQKEI